MVSTLSKSLLNDILQNINSSIAILRKDFKRLHELVITLNARIGETKDLRTDLRDLSLKIDTMASKLFELEKSKEKLEYLIREVETTGRSTDTIAHINLEQKINKIEQNVGKITTQIPLFKKILVIFFVLLGVVVYISGETTKFFEIIGNLIKRVLF